MTFLDLMNQFSRIRGDLDLTAADIGIFTMIALELNKARNENNDIYGTKVKLGNPKLTYLAGISRSTLSEKRNKLKQLGLINFKSGTGKGSYATYSLGELFDIRKDTRTVSRTLPWKDNRTETSTENRTRIKNKDIRDKKEENTIKEKIPYQEIVDLYNSICGDSLPKIRKLTDKIKDGIRLRWKIFQTLDEWQELFEAVVKIPFVNGENQRGWKADFRWLITNDDNPMKILEGNYACKNKLQPNQPTKKDTFDLVRGPDYGTNYDVDDNALIQEVLKNESSTGDGEEPEQKSIAWQKSQKL